MENWKKYGTIQCGKKERVCFSRTKQVLEMPNLIEVQKNSYKWFLDEGLREVFQRRGRHHRLYRQPGTDFPGLLPWTRNRNTRWKSARSGTRPMPPPSRCACGLRNKETGEIKEQEIFMGDFPADDRQRHLHHQRRRTRHCLPAGPLPWRVLRHRATSETGQAACIPATVIPNRGAWLEYETDANDVFYVRIDKNRKLPITVPDPLPWACGTDAEIMELFGEDERIVATHGERRGHQDQRGGAARDLQAPASRRAPHGGQRPDAAATACSLTPSRYDLSTVGRYKFNKKLAMAARLMRPDS